MTYMDKWLGLAGGGFGFSVIGGVGVYQLNLFNMGGSPVPIRVFIIGKRLGVTLQAEMAHAVCFLTGVRSPNDFTELKSSGVDWALALGVKVDSFVKGSAKAVQALAKCAEAGGNWAAHEGTKKIAQSIMGDFSVAPKGPSFVLLPTPVALAAGAGVWYEWQTMTKVGSDIAWEYVKPVWWLDASGGRVMLHMHNIPEPDGATLNFHIRRKVWGPDDLIRFGDGRGRDEGPLLTGTVKNGMLCDRLRSETGADGFDLGACLPTGHTEIGMLTTSRNKDVAKNATIEIGVSVCRGQINLYKWDSSDYVKVTTDGEGRFTGAPDRGRKR